jgi:hypothetical protein
LYVQNMVGPEKGRGDLWDLKALDVFPPFLKK